MHTGVMPYDECVFLSSDDKAKIQFGEPGSALSTGVRGKKSIVPVGTVLGALDHDVNQKGNINTKKFNNFCFSNLSFIEDYKTFSHIIQWGV